MLPEVATFRIVRKINLRNGMVYHLGPNDPRHDDPDFVDPDGRLIKIEDWPELYKLCENKFGGNKDEGTFRIPDLREH